MGRILTDSEIAELLLEKKPLQHDWTKRLRITPKSNYAFRQKDITVLSPNGHEFRIVLRQNEINQLDFSIILVFVDVDRTDHVLIRHNGKHPSQHTNKIEKTSIRNVFHIHKATERYQVAGLNIDGFAEATGSYSSYDTALQRFIEFYGFEVQPDPSGQGNFLSDN